MTINPIDPFTPIIGDDNPYVTSYLRDMPTGYHFADLTFDTSLPLQTSIKDDLLGFAERYYSNFEVNGITVRDWFNNLQLSYDMNKDRFEKLLESIYNIEFEKGNTTTRAKATSDNRDTVRDKTGSDTNTSDRGKVTGDNRDTIKETKNDKIGSFNESENVENTGSDTITSKDDIAKSGNKTTNEDGTNNQDVTTTDIELAFSSSNTDPSKEQIIDNDTTIKNKIDEVTNENESLLKSETVVKSGSDARDKTGSNNESDTGKETLKDVGSSSENEHLNQLATNSENENIKDVGSSNESETIKVSRFLGENSLDYYVNLMDKYPNIFSIFVRIFEDDFIISGVLIW